MERDRQETNRQRGLREDRRPENRRLRELVGEMLAAVRIAASRDLWTPEERLSASGQLDDLIGDTMRQLRHEVMEPGTTDSQPQRHWCAPRLVFSRAPNQGVARERQVRMRLRLRREIDALLDAIRIASNPESGARGRWPTDAERMAYERQLEHIMSAVRAEAMGRAMES